MLEILNFNFAEELPRNPEAKKIPTGFLGEIRPDFMVISFLEGNAVFDFIHAETSSSHAVKTEYYQTVGDVLFEKATDTVSRYQKIQQQEWSGNFFLLDWLFFLLYE